MDNFKEKLLNLLGVILFFGYFGGMIITFGYLTFFDNVAYNWWNWIILLQIHIFLATLWPFYWSLRLIGIL